MNNKGFAEVLFAVLIFAVSFGGLYLLIEHGREQEIKEMKEAPMKSIVVIDGCEYLSFPTYYHMAYTHKGNCKNPVHIYNK